MHIFASTNLFLDIFTTIQMRNFLLLIVATAAAGAGTGHFTIHPDGYWTGQVDGHHLHDPLLAQALVNFFKQEQATSIADLGCGLGKYVKTFRDNGLLAVGYDGHPETPIITAGLGSVLDLSRPIDIPVSDWVLSLEVAEHLPQKFEAIFLDNLHRSNDRGIVLSWALKGQGGDGHFNEQNNDYVKAAITKLGYVNDLEAERLLRSSVQQSYFRSTVMVFRRVV